MAETKNTITIKFKPEGDKGLVNAIKALDRATQSLVKSQGSLAKTSGTLKSKQDKLTASQKKAEQQTRILGGTFAVLRSKMLLVNFALGLGIRQVLKFADQAAKVESMSIAFNNLSNDTQGAEFALSKLKEATNDTMSEFDLFQQANNAMILGVSNNSEEMAEMFDIAQRLGRALGRDTASSVESLVTGIGRQSRLMLDNIGIIVRSEEAYEDYAEKLGVTAESLTDAQKKQAFLEATMESARKKVKTVGEETLTTRDSLDQLSTSFTNLTTAVGQNIPFFQKIINAANTLIKATTEQIKGEEEIITLTKQRSQFQENISKLNKRLIGEQDSLQVQQSGLSKLNIIAVNNAKANVEATQNEITINEERLKAVDKAIFKFNEEQLAQRNVKEETRKAREETQKATDTAEANVLANKKAVEVLEQLAEANKTVYADDIDFQLMQIQLQADAYKEMKIDQVAVNEWAEGQKKNAVIKNLEETNGLYSAFEASYSTFISSLTDMDMTGQERRKQILEAGKNAFISFLGEMLKEKIKQMLVEQVITKTAETSAVVSAGVTGSLIASQYAVPASLAATASFGGAAAAGLSAIGASIAGTKALAVFEQGGLVGGQRHSQGGTIIEAEQGEFVMSRQAVQSIGLETMNQINQGGGAGSTINLSINGGIVDESYVNNELIPALNKATALGNRINA